MPDLKLDWCSYEAAKYACEHWHYSKSVPMPPLNMVGVWESGKFIGCVLYGRGASPKLGARFSLEQTEVCELVRVALASHETAVSRIVAISLKFLKKHNANLKLVVSFADTNQGHHGGIYQAGNWVYSGTSNSNKFFRDKAGRMWHPRQVSTSGEIKQFGKRVACVKRSDCEPVVQAGKHRYLMPLCESINPAVEALRKPYPKRVVDDKASR